MEEFNHIRRSERNMKSGYKIDLLSKNPHAYPVVDRRINIRRSVLSKQTTIYYEVKTDAVVILSLFDNRKDPDSLKI